MRNRVVMNQLLLNVLPMIIATILVVLLIYYQDLVWWFVAGVAAMIFVRDWFYWKIIIDRSTIRELFYKYVYDGAFPSFILRTRRFTNKEIQIATDEMYVVERGLLSDGYDRDDVERKLSRAEQFVKVIGLPEFHLNPFVCIGGICYAAAVILPILAIFSEWDKRWQAWLMASVIFLLAGGAGTAFIFWLDREPTKQKNLVHWN